MIGLRDRMVAEVAVLRSKRSDLKLQLLCDGAPEMWNLLDEGSKPKFGDDLQRLVDLYHLTEKLAAAAHTAHTIDTDSKGAGERLAEPLENGLAQPWQAATDILRRNWSGLVSMRVWARTILSTQRLPTSRLIAPTPIG